MSYKYAIALVAVLMLAIAAALKAATLTGPLNADFVSEAALPLAEGALAAAGAAFLLGRRTGWFLSLAFLAFGNVALYKALAERPCGCLGKAAVSPWLMFSIDAVLSLSLLLVAGWTPWRGRRPRWAGVGAALAVVAGAGGLLAISRTPAAGTSPKLVADVLAAGKANYEGLDSERYDLETDVTQTGVKEPVHFKSATFEFSILPRSVTRGTVSRRAGLVTYTASEGGRLSTDGRTQLQYAPNIKTAWVRTGDGLATESIDPRRYGLPQDWDPALGVAAGGTEWRRFDHVDLGPRYVEIAYRARDASYSVSIVCDKEANLLPASTTYTGASGQIERRCEFTYLPVPGGGKFRLNTCSVTMYAQQPAGGGGATVTKYKVMNYERGGAERPDEVDFRPPAGTRIVDTLAGVQRAPAPVTELFSLARAGATGPAPTPVGWVGWSALAAVNLIYALLALRRLRAVRSASTS